MFRIFTTILTLFLGVHLMAQVSLLSEYTDFHYRSWTRFGQMENVTADQSGAYYFFLRNDGAVPEEISGIRFFDGAIERFPEGYRVWPKVLQPGQMGFIIARGNNAQGFRGGEQIRAVISTAAGQTLEQVITNATSTFRISNVMPTQDYSHLKIYFRNDDTQPRTLKTFFVNGRTFDLEGVDKSMLVGEQNIIQPNHIAILIYTQPEPMKQLMPMMMSVQTARSTGPDEVTSAAIRLVDSKFHFGTWDSGALLPANINARKRFRELMIDAIHGQGNYQHMQSAHDDFFIAAMQEVPFGIPVNEANARNVVRAHRGKPYIRLWSVDDEPDLSGRDMDQQALRSQIYWDEDSIIPSFVNLAVQKKYNRYGWYTDIVGMDHYAAPTAPNIIPLTWVPIVGRNGEMVEALEYSEVLKFNTEPRRNWSWVQMAPGPWSQEPVDWSINLQFWLHIMGGAKSMEFFVAQTQTKERWPAQWEAARVCVKQLASIRNIILDGDYANIVQRGNPNILTRALVGPEAMAVFVVNNTARFNWNGSFDPIRYNETLTPTNYSVEFDMPTWIVPNDVYRVGLDGEKIRGVNLQSLGNGRYRITSSENVHKQSHVFIISTKEDDQAPEPPIYLHAVDIKDSAQYTLSWDVPFDNYGIRSYDISRNGSFYTNVGIPILEVSDGYLPCPEIVWEAVAIDPSGNRSIPARWVISTQVELEQPSIVSTSGDQLVLEGANAQFSVEIEGAFDTYEWQYNDGSGWKSASALPGASGADGPILSLSNVIAAWDGFSFRLMAGSTCFGSSVSEENILNVQVNTGIADLLAAGFRVFPNPSNSILNLRLPDDFSAILLSLQDMQGREVLASRRASAVSDMLDMSKISSGMYLLKIDWQGKSYGLKVLKQ